MPIANRSTNVRAKPTGLGQPNRGGACEDGSNAAKPRADVGEQESLLAELRGLGNNLADRRVESTWFRKATGRDSVNATISMCTDFLVGTDGKLADIAIVVNRCVDILLPNRRDLARNDCYSRVRKGASMSGNYAIDVWP